MSNQSAPAELNPSPQDVGQIMSLIGGYRISHAIYVVAKLGIPDLLVDGPKTCDQLVNETKTNSSALYRVLRFLAGAGLFNEIRLNEFGLTPLGSTLCNGVPGSVRASALMTLSDFHQRPWSDLMHTVQTGETAFGHTYGKGLFEALSENTAAAAIFNASMTASSALWSAGLVKHYDFSEIRKIVDVGGGHGRTLAAVLKSNPAMRGVLFDLPDVVAGAARVLEDAGVKDRCEVVGGSFFESVPRGGDAYILRQIVHDWDEDQSLTILRNCRAAMTSSGRLLVIEREIVPDNRAAMRVLHIDMQMLVNVGGRERTEAEYQTLYERAGFRLEKVVSLQDSAGFCVFEGMPLD